MRNLIFIILLFINLWLFAQVPCISNNWKENYAPDTLLLYKHIDTTNLYLHIFLPQNYNTDERYPCVIFFFGGGWRIGAPCQFYPQADYFAKRGMIAICAEYRIYSKHGTSPVECVKDAKSAMRWLRSNASLFNIDTSKIVASGGSAGGHLAAATAVLNDINESTDDLTVNAKPNALVLYNPAIRSDKELDTMIVRFGERWRTLSVYHNIENYFPPCLIMHGTKDAQVPIENIYDLRDLLVKKEMNIELVVYDNTGHGFFNYQKDNNPYFYKTLENVDHFFSQLNYITKK